MELVDLVVELATLRLYRVVSRDGHKPDAAMKIVDEVLAQNAEAIRGLKTPDAIIAVIMDTYFRQLMAPMAGKKGPFDLEAQSKRLIKEIEKTRSETVKGTWAYPNTIEEYVVYRLGLETKAMFGQTPVQLGMDGEIVAEMIDLARDALLDMYTKAE